jgi:hypothetical protein
VTEKERCVVCGRGAQAHLRGEKNYAVCGKLLEKVQLQARKTGRTVEEVLDRLISLGMDDC